MGVWFVSVYPGYLLVELRLHGFSGVHESHS